MRRRLELFASVFFFHACSTIMRSVVAGLVGNGAV
jgi:hypothetical protein